MDYFTSTEPMDWKPSSIYTFYKEKHPEKNKNQLLFSIHKDLVFLSKHDSATGAAAKTWLKKWENIKGNFLETPTGSNDSRLPSAQTSSNANPSIKQAIGINNGTVTQSNNFYSQPSSSGDKPTNGTKKKRDSSADSLSRKKPKVNHTENGNDEKQDENTEPEHDSTNQVDQTAEATLEFAQWLRDFARMDWIEQLEHLYAKHGDNDNLDLMRMKLSKRQITTIKHYLKPLKFSFAVTKEEATCLARLRKCASQDEFDALKVDLFKTSQVSPGIEYIRTAIHQISLFWQNNKNILNNLEDWWRIFLYGPVFDNALTSIKECNVIRSESESVAYKDYYILFKDVIPTDTKIKSEKVDMVLRTTDNMFDIFSAEDKPLMVTQKVVQETIEKNQKRRMVTLDVMQKSLPLPELISEFANYTALWHGNHLVLHCTRKVNNRYIHYEVAKAFIPLSPTNYEGISRLLLIVLSLKRHIVYNHKLLAVLGNKQSLITMDEGTRSPIPLQEQDDSVEYDEQFIEQLKAELNIETENDHLDKLQQYRTAIKGVSLGDEEQGIITTTDLSNIFHDIHPVEESEPVHEPAYDMLENQTSIIIRIDLPDVSREQVCISASPPKTLKVTGTRPVVKDTECLSLHRETFTKFSRTIDIDKAVNFKQAKITVESGVVEIIIPKEATVIIL